MALSRMNRAEEEEALSDDRDLDLRSAGRRKAEEEEEGGGPSFVIPTASIIQTNLLRLHQRLSCQ